MICFVIWTFNFSVTHVKHNKNWYHWNITELQCAICAVMVCYLMRNVENALYLYTDKKIFGSQAAETGSGKTGVRKSHTTNSVLILGEQVLIYWYA